MPRMHEELSHTAEHDEHQQMKDGEEGSGERGEINEREAQQPDLKCNEQRIDTEVVIKIQNGIDTEATE